MILLIILILFIVVFAYFFVGKAPEAEKIKWGVVFSQKYAEDLGVDWKENYEDILKDLGAREIKIITHWDLIEPERDIFQFDDLDWKINTTEEYSGRIFLVIGMKTGRWPECHIPKWAEKLSKEEQQERILNLLEKIVLRYKYRDVIWAWQVENEALFPFGECPWTDKRFLKEETSFVRNLDSKNRPIIIGDSGEFSLWLTSARIGDIVSHTLHRRTWFPQLQRYVFYPIPPVYYWRKSLIVDKIFNKDVICGELQAEPWGPNVAYKISPEEQEKTMNLEKFKDNVDFAKRTGIDTFYFWGVEWWYWMKENQNNPEIWNEAKKLF